MAAKKKSGVHEEVNPGKTSDEIEGDKTYIAHTADTGNERDEGAHDGNETGEDNGTTAVFLEKGMRAFEVLLSQKGRILALEYRRADSGANPVIDRVAKDRRDPQHKCHEVHIQACLGFRTKSSGRKQHRVARKEGNDDQACLNEDNQKKKPVSPQTVMGYDFRQMQINVEDEIDEFFDEIEHGLEGMFS
jgi:hypothetical protein